MNVFSITMVAGMDKKIDQQSISDLERYSVNRRTVKSYENYPSKGCFTIVPEFFNSF